MALHCDTVKGHLLPDLRRYIPAKQKHTTTKASSRAVLVVVCNMKDAKGRNRTGDTRIFSPVLYQLSYLGLSTHID